MYPWELKLIGCLIEWALLALLAGICRRGTFTWQPIGTFNWETLEPWNPFLGDIYLETSEFIDIARRQTICRRTFLIEWALLTWLPGKCRRRWPPLLLKKLYWHCSPAYAGGKPSLGNLRNLYFGDSGTLSLYLGTFTWEPHGSLTSFAGICQRRWPLLAGMRRRTFLIEWALLALLPAICWQLAAALSPKLVLLHVSLLAAAVASSPSLSPFMISLLAAAAALSPKLVSLHDLALGGRWACQVRSCARPSWLRSLPGSFGS